jgi:hypothetical protein
MMRVTQVDVCVGHPLTSPTRDAGTLPTARLSAVE